MKNKLTLAQEKVLDYLKRYPGPGSLRVAEALYPRMPLHFADRLISKVMDVLEQEGYINRDNYPINKENTNG